MGEEEVVDAVGSTVGCFLLVGLLVGVPDGEVEGDDGCFSDVPDICVAVAFSCLLDDAVGLSVDGFEEGKYEGAWDAAGVEAVILVTLEEDSNEVITLFSSKTSFRVEFVSATVALGKEGGLSMLVWRSLVLWNDAAPDCAGVDDDGRDEGSSAVMGKE